MNKKVVNADVICKINKGKWFLFPLTVGKIYKNVHLSYTSNIKLDGMIQLIDDNGKIDCYSMAYFELKRFT